MSTSTNTPAPKRRFKLGPRGRWVVGGALVLGFLISLIWIWVGSPLPLQLWLLLALVAGGSLTAFMGLFVTKDLPKHWRTAISAGAGLIAAVVGLIGVPVPEKSADPKPGQSSPPISSPSPSPTSSEPDPLTAKFDFGNGWCEDFSTSKSLLPSLPRPKENIGIDAKWMYEHGGATLGTTELTVEGKTDHAVVIRGMRVVDFKRNPPPADAIGILPCGGKGGAILPRYFEVNMSARPKLIARPSPDDRVKNKSVAKFSLKVSSSDPEVFYFKTAGTDCFCEWRLAIDWTSGGRSGTTIVDHDFGKIRSDTKDYKDRQVYWLYEGEWIQ